MSFDFSALLSRSKRKPAVESIPEPPPEVIGRRLSESEILELWQERSCIVFEANVAAIPSRSKPSNSNAPRTIIREELEAVAID